MARLPIARGEVLRGRFGWRTGVRGQVANTDIDGLLSAALLFATKGWPLWGFSNTEQLWLAPEAADSLRATPAETAWVDLDMSWPGLQSVGQHVVARVDEDHREVSAYSLAANPNVIGHHANSPRVDYRDKYPFGTFQWLWWLADLDVPATANAEQTGFIWMPDGGFESIRGDWRGNCIDWATRRLPGSPLAPLIDEGLDQDATRYVIAAETLLRTAGISPSRFRNHQYRLSEIRKGRGAVYANPQTPDGRAEIQLVLDVIASTFDWPPLAIPPLLHRFDGRWNGNACPAGWPGAAARREIVSFVVGFRNKYFYTTPEPATSGLASLSSVLPG